MISAPCWDDLPLDNANLYLYLISAAGMSLVGAAAIVLWRRQILLRYRWLFALTAICVAIHRWCWIQFGRQDSAALLEPEMAVVN